MFTEFDLHCALIGKEWDDSRTDEDQIGASYKDLEWVMKIGLKKYESNKNSLAAKEIKLIE